MTLRKREKRKTLQQQSSGSFDGSQQPVRCTWHLSHSFQLNEGLYAIDAISHGAHNHDDVFASLSELPDFHDLATPHTSARCRHTSTCMCAALFSDAYDTSSPAGIIVMQTKARGGARNHVCWHTDALGASE
jgi:hypothetical protein